MEKNKYQEALDYLNQPLNWKDDAYKIGKSITDLQELINYNNKQVELHFDEKANYVNENEMLKLRIKRYDKALDKACDIICRYRHRLHNSNTYYGIMALYDGETKEQCKEQLLNDE